MRDLVGSAICIDLLRARRNPVQVLGPWVARHEAIASGVVRCDVLRAIVNRRFGDRIKALFAVFATARIDEPTCDRAMELAWSLDGRACFCRGPTC